MTTREVDIHELKRLDSRQFEKEHMDFVNSIDWDWWEYVESEFKREMDELGVAVDEISFEGIDYGYASAVWAGSFRLAPFMKRMGLDEKYLPLYLAVDVDSSWVDVSIGGGYRTHMEINFREYTHYVVAQGIFSGLDEKDWEELVSDQWRESDLEERAREFAQDKADNLLKSLQAEWDYISSEEYFIESCEANEVKFEVALDEEEEEGETV